jgi:phenylacetate-CoA ligase
MPLIRYRVGDSGQAPDWNHACACGRRLPVLRNLRGRTNDVVIAPDGRRVFWLNPVFYGQPVREAQIIQQSLDRIQVRYVPGNGFDLIARRTIRRRLIERLGPMQVDFEAVERIPRGPNGKFQAVVNRLGREALVSAAMDPSSPPNLPDLAFKSKQASGSAL